MVGVGSAKVVVKLITSHSPQASAWGHLSLRIPGNRFNGLQITRMLDLFPETVETVSELNGSADPQAEAWGE